MPLRLSNRAAVNPAFSPLHRTAANICPPMIDEFVEYTGPSSSFRLRVYAWLEVKRRHFGWHRLWLLPFGRNGVRLYDEVCGTPTGLPISPRSMAPLRAF